ncbi:Penicillin-binding protein 1C [Candidatus Entotheonellaceae bacterium PAL068K]
MVHPATTRKTGVVVLLCACLWSGSGALLVVSTTCGLRPTVDSLQDVLGRATSLLVLDRHGTPLMGSHAGRWNIHDHTPLHHIPEFLQQAFLLSEDKRFYRHRGPDWLARLHALWQNAKAFRVVRGASTITEQVVRIVHPRPRTLWSRWLEGWEAWRLEKTTSKADILEFYLNQVPYAANRRGVVQAARYYFNRDLETLRRPEMLALAVLVRAPSRPDLYAHPHDIEPALRRLAASVAASGLRSAADLQNLTWEPFQLQKPPPAIRAAHFVSHALKRTAPALTKPQHKLRTTLDGNLQRTVQAMLDWRLSKLKNRQVHNGAALVVEHQTGEVLAWTVAGGNGSPERPGSFIDAVTARRQPGSALKPFLYALALELGWSAATRINDSPLAEAVGSGLHRYRNYSRTFYGPVTLREALGNSLNIPALRTIQFVGAARYLTRLRDLGFATLDQHPNFYGDGLALGNGEVTLLDLVQAYAVLANRGDFLPLTVLQDDALLRDTRRIFAPEVCSLIGHILSDPHAKRLEFVPGGVLDLPVQTAVKTGTSSDYRDAWAIGFNYRYTVGIWMGNLDRQPTQGITGSTGPAMLLRGIFAVLNQHQDTRPLYLSPRLVQQNLCRETGATPIPGASCSPYTEWFIPGTPPGSMNTPSEQASLRWRRPTNGLQLAMAPRIPDEQEAFAFEIQGVNEQDWVAWTLNGNALARTYGGTYVWPVQRGEHRLRASIHKGTTILVTPEIGFVVK